jgi:hypothetical protein
MRRMPLMQGGWPCRDALQCVGAGGEFEVCQYALSECGCCVGHLYELVYCATSCACKAGHQLPADVRPNVTPCALGACRDGYCASTADAGGDSEVSDASDTSDAFDIDDGGDVSESD